MLQSPVAEEDRRLNDQDWLQMFELYQRQSLFNHEPDFEQALREYKEAIRQTAEDPSKGYHPPAQFMPHAPESSRESLWREGRRYLIESAWIYLF